MCKADALAKKGKSIRAKRVEEMVNERRMEEEAAMTHQFRHKPVPPDVFIPRYQSLQEAEAARRANVRAQSIAITAQREKPFSFWARDRAKQQMKQDEDDLMPEEMRKIREKPFKANPIPRSCSVQIYGKKVHEEELRRRERIRKNAEISYGKAKMPPTMQMYADRKKQEIPKQQEEQFSFKP